MIVKEFNIHPRRTNGIYRLLQHKLRVTMNCYTILNLTINKENQTITFYKSHRINGIRMNDPKEHRGFYEIEPINDDICNFKITITE